MAHPGAAARPASVARVGLGFAVLAVERLRGPVGGTLQAGAGIAQVAATEAWGLARLAGAAAAGPARSALRSLAAQDRVRDVLDGARGRGKSLVDSSRADAMRVAGSLVPYLVSSVLPRLIDGLVPYLEQQVVPRLVDSSVPLLRERVLPVVISDLTDDPLLRTLLLEQSRSLVGQATERLRNATSRADDRVENLFRTLMHRGGVRRGRE